VSGTSSPSKPTKRYTLNPRSPAGRRISEFLAEPSTLGNTLVGLSDNTTGPAAAKAAHLKRIAKELARLDDLLSQAWHSRPLSRSFQGHSRYTTRRVIWTGGMSTLICRSFIGSLVVRKGMRFPRYGPRCAIGAYGLGWIRWHPALDSKGRYTSSKQKYRSSLFSRHLHTPVSFLSLGERQYAVPSWPPRPCYQVRIFPCHGTYQAQTRRCTIRPGINSTPIFSINVA